MECIHTKLVQKEGEKRLVPVEIDGSNYIENIDYILIATGSMPENKVIEMFEKNKWGYVKIDENMETSIKNVFAGGDIAGERATVAWAARSGRNAADKIIDSFIK
jgi:glutamate synthase (NADPH/NADH) small chain